MRVRGILKGAFATAFLLCCGKSFASAGLTVLELFTSEGCSSCPPAERYLGELSQRQDVLALSFHVGYWDSLGWPDPFAFPATVDRQNAYARRFNLASVYTPQLIVNGAQEFVGSDRRSIGSHATLHEPVVPIAIAAEAGQLRISLSAVQGITADRGSDDVLLVPFRRKVISRIGRGENAGREVEEFNVARELRVLGHSQGAAAEFRVALASLPHDATDVAVLVQRRSQGEIVGATRFALVPE